MKFAESVTFWKRLLGKDAEAWPGVHIFQALAEKFLSGVDIADPLAFAGIHGAPVLYLANHQVYLESMLFNMALAPLQGRPAVGLAKIEHRDRWLGRFIDLLFGYPGLHSPVAIEYFDRESPDATVRAVARLEDLANRDGQSILVHVEGTRRRCARRGRVQAMSPLWPEVAVKNGWAIVPVRFVGGLPVEDQGSKLDAPVGFGSQTIRVGAPIAAAELAPLGDEARVARVRGAINALQDNRTEEPEPADPIFAAAVDDWVQRSGVHPMAATILMALVRHRRATGSIDPLCDALAACAEDGRPLRAPPSLDAAWVERLGRFLLGEGASSAFVPGAALQAS
jgi:1-acyl-sn-glycerol-3-phosphate acyltransferase